jgi:hypothetical protein
MKVTTRWLLVVCAIFLSFLTNAQDLKIELGPGEIAMNEMFTISVTVQNERIRSYDNFPEIPGFSKRGTTSSSSTSIINGQMSFSQTIVQNYMPTKEGTFVIQPFTMTVNGNDVKSSGKTVTVKPPAANQRQADPFGDPFEEFFGGRRGNVEYVDVKEDAFLALSTDKESIYRGEGVTATLAFYVAESNRAQLQWHDLANQVGEILRVLKPANCWEENFNIDNVTGTRMQINGKTYTQFKIYQAAFFPLSNNPIEFPAVSLKMIKYLVAKNPTFFGANRQEDFVNFTTRPKTVKVLDLPPHPLKDKVAVGYYNLEESLSNAALSTGESFSYQFTVSGEGNISAIQAPEIRGKQNLEFFPPNIQQEVRRGNGKVTGRKQFSYYVVPNEPGTFALKDKMQFIFFNTRSAKYDTLKPKAVVSVIGESKKNQAISSHDLGPFYDRVDLESNKLQSLSSPTMLSLFANSLIFLMLAVSAYVIFKK